MCSRQILQEKEVLNVQDIKLIFGVGTSKAYQIMRCIKSVSDRLDIKGRVHVKDYFDYIDRNKKRTPATAIASAQDGIQKYTQL